MEQPFTPNCISKKLWKSNGAKGGKGLVHKNVQNAKGGTKWNHISLHLYVSDTLTPCEALCAFVGNEERMIPL